MSSTSSITNENSGVSRLPLISNDLAGLVVPVEGDYTKGAVISAYSDDVETFANVVSLNDQDPTNLQLFFAGQQLEESITNLIELARDGIIQKIDPNDPNSPEVASYMTLTMTDRLDALFDSLKSAGAIITPNGNNPPTVQVSVEAVRAWLDQSLLSPTVDTLVNNAVNVVEGAGHSIQALVELEYVRTANELIVGKLADLEEALQVAESVNSVLADVQDIHNQVSLTENPDLVVPPDPSGTSQSDIDDWMDAYTTNANNALAPIGIQIDENLSGTPRNLTLELTEAEQTLAEQLTLLETIAGVDSDIYKRVSLVHDGIVAALQSPTAFAKWFQDGYVGGEGGGTQPGSGSELGSGVIQQQINSAISSAQAFNSSQTQEVSRFMFVFEEYYKSASSVLSSLSKMIERMAQNISR